MSVSRPDAPIGVAVLGSTGSIGTQTLDVIRTHSDRFRVVALAAGRNSDLLAAQAAEFGVPTDRARTTAGDSGVLAGLAGLQEADVVLNAVVGFAGLPVTLTALEAGKRLALANKESLIAAGPVVARARAGGGEIVPVDSEHSAIYQALLTGPLAAVRRIIITASGGPFRGRTRADLDHVTVADALAHPTWSMGPKITVDSSTLMNKGLEVIEANELFGVGLDRIEVVVHPQSVVHGMVEWTDGATIAQLSMPDMRLPIAYALAAPGRTGHPPGPRGDPEPPGVIDWSKLGTLTFEPPDTEAFPCLALAYAAARTGGGAPTVLNAANEVAVAAFLGGRLPWRGIAEVVGEVTAAHAPGNLERVEDVTEADAWARARAQISVERRSAA